MVKQKILKIINLYLRNSFQFPGGVEVDTSNALPRWKNQTKSFYVRNYIHTISPTNSSSTGDVTKMFYDLMFQRKIQFKSNCSGTIFITRKKMLVEEIMMWNLRSGHFKRKSAICKRIIQCQRYKLMPTSLLRLVPSYEIV